MNHQPFEAWLLSDEDLLPEDALALEQHLASCAQCAALQAALSGVDDLFADVSDFMAHWQETFALDRQIELISRHRWQSVIMLILIGNIIAGLVFLFGTQFLTTFDTPIQIILSWMYRLAAYVSFINGFQNLILTLYRTLTNIVPAGIWAVLATGLTGAFLVWFVTIKSLFVLPRRM